MRFAAILAASLLLAAVPAAGDGLFDGEDCRYSAPRNASTPAAGISRIVIHAESGFLKVDGADGAAQVVVRGTACSSDQDFLERMALKLSKSGSVLHIDAEIPSRTVVFGFFSARLDFAVTVPSGVPVSIEDGSGWIQTSNTGALEIEDGSGSIEVKQARGGVAVQDGSGAITLDGVTGDVSIEDGSGEMTLRNITGNITIEDGSGSIEVARVEGAVRIDEDGSGSIDIQQVKRDVVVDDDGSGNVSVADVGGNFTVSHKGAGSIVHERVAGTVTLPKDRR